MSDTEILEFSETIDVEDKDLIPCTSGNIYLLKQGPRILLPKSKSCILLAKKQDPGGLFVDCTIIGAENSAFFTHSDIGRVVQRNWNYCYILNSSIIVQYSLGKLTIKGQ